MKRKITRKVTRPIIYMITGSSGDGKTKTTIPVRFRDQSYEDQGRHSIPWVTIPYQANRRRLAEEILTVLNESIRRKRQL